MNPWSTRWFEITKKRSYFALWSTFIKWIVLGSVVGILSGTASAFSKKLGLRNRCTFRASRATLFVASWGVFVSFLYMRYGKNSAKGNNLIIEQIQDGNETIPLRMAPLVLFGTLVTHLFGGSAGREGTAVQMGGSLAEWFGKLIKISPLDRKILLMCGISAGFGSIFGTPLAGTLFGLEVVTIGLISQQALLPCFVASFVGDLVTTRLWGVHHTHYVVNEFPALSLMIILKVVLASVIFGLVSMLFSELTHFLKKSSPPG